MTDSILREMRPESDISVDYDASWIICGYEFDITVSRDVTEDKVDVLAAKAEAIVKRHMEALKAEIEAEISGASLNW